MNYETTHHIGDHLCTHRPKAKKASRSTQRVFAVDAKTQRRGRDQKRQKTACPNFHASNGFLRTSFLPKLKVTESLQDVNTAETERDFYASLSRLTQHYDIEVVQAHSCDYPYNIALSLWQAQRELKKKISDFQKIQLLQDKGRTFLSWEERYDTGATIYYIPVIPLYRMLREASRRPAAHLLLSVCTYLYHIADIPYYRQENSFLYWQYEMLKEWLLEDEPEEYADQLDEIEKSESIGAYMEKKIFDHAHLTFFNARLTHFTARDSIDRDCLKVAEKAYALYQDYPHETVFRNAKPFMEADDRDDIATMDTYVSFCADAHGWLSDNLEESVNNHLQQFGQMEEPAIIKHFDGSDIVKTSLDFERRLFALLGDLAGILYNY